MEGQGGWAEYLQKRKNRGQVSPLQQLELLETWFHVSTKVT